MHLWFNLVRGILTSSSSLQDTTLSGCAKDLWGDIEGGMKRDRNGPFNTFPVLVKPLRNGPATGQASLQKASRNR